MSFTSSTFFAMVIVSCALYYMLPRFFQNWIVLVASVIFVIRVSSAALAVLVCEIVVVYLLGLLLQFRPAGRRLWLAAGLFFCVGSLAALKYSGLLLQTAAAFWPSLAEVRPLSALVAALGISYYTLTAMGYLIDVAKGRVAAEQNLLHFALFLGFFPQISSGPIGRAQQLLPQWRRKRSFDYELFCTGATRMLLGYFKKLVIADGLAVAVDPVFAQPENFSGPIKILAALLYAYQLYCDFSGYTDIARGVAELFGIRLAQNFRRPFAAHSFAALWNRWHLSLSKWLADYIYIPLGGSRRGVLRMCLATLIVFTVSGIWHDVGWIFPVWGLLNGLFVVADKLSRPARAALAARLSGYEGGFVQAVWQRMWVYAIFAFCFTMFRVGADKTAGFGECVAFYRGMLADWDVLLQPDVLVAQLKAMSIGRKLTAYLGGSVLFSEMLEWAAERKDTEGAQLVRSWPAFWRYVIYYGLLLMILFFGQLGSSSFIYFQF